MLSVIHNYLLQHLTRTTTQENTKQNVVNHYDRYLERELIYNTVGVNHIVQAIFNIDQVSNLGI